MAKGSTFANDTLALWLNGTAIANLADNAGSSPLTNLYVSLHTADPSAGTQATSELSYTGYARVAVARTSGGWTGSGGTWHPAATVAFPQRTDGGATQTATYFAVGTAASGTGKVLYAGQITSPSGGIPVTQNVTPRLTPAGNVTLSES